MGGPAGRRQQPCEVLRWLIWIPSALQPIAAYFVKENHNRMTTLDSSGWAVSLQAALQPPGFFLQSSQPLHNPAEPDSGGDSENDSLALLPKRTVRPVVWIVGSCSLRPLAIDPAIRFINRVADTRARACTWTRCRLP